MLSVSQIITLLIGLAALITACLGVYEKLIVVKSEITKNKNVSVLGYVSDPDGWVNLRSYPNVSSEILTRVKNGTRVEILNNSSAWTYVKIDSGAKGYIHTSRIISSLSD